MKRPHVALPALLLAGCGSHPLGYLDHTDSAAADRIRILGLGFGAIAIGVTLVIVLLIGLAIVRGRRRLHAEGDQVGRDMSGLYWIYWGVGISFPILVAMAVWNFVVTRAVTDPPRTPPLTVEITAHRWWWEIRYLDLQHPAGVFLTANDLVLPVGVPVKVELRSADVIHDFWVPKLGPKMDVVPGRTNVTWIEADHIGSYRGLCAEYCGLEHARMAFTVQALTPAAFVQWRSAQLASGAAPPSAGRTLFATACAACHTVRGTEAEGILGPDLTHFASRPTIAAGVLPNTVAGRLKWLADTQGVKPGALMPQVPLSATDRQAVVRYLGSLR